MTIIPREAAGPLNSEQKPKLGSHLRLDRCPHCSVAMPVLIRVRTGGEKLRTISDATRLMRWWETYVCTSFGGVVLASSIVEAGLVSEYYPTLPSLDTDIPEPPSDYLGDDQES